LKQNNFGFCVLGSIEVVLNFRSLALSMVLIIISITSVLPAGRNAEFKTTRSGDVYLFRGTGYVFSSGLNTIAKDLLSKGLNAHVFKHGAWKSVAKHILAQAKRSSKKTPITLIGHSAGGRAALNLAKVLARAGIRVNFLVTFDPHTRAFIGRNVKRVLNYYIPNDSNSNLLLRPKGFTGSLRNIDVSGVPGLNHLNMEENPKLQRRIVKMTLALSRSL